MGGVLADNYFRKTDTLVQIFILPMSFAKNDKSIQRSTERK